MSGKKHQTYKGQKSNSQKKETASVNSKIVTRKYLPYIVLIFMTILVYSFSFNTEFIYNWDDAGYVVGNQYIKSLSFQNIKNIFGEIYYMSNYHPLTTLSYAIDWAVAGENPVWYHVVNLLFHLLNSLLVFVLIKKIFNPQNDWIPFFIAMLFAVHPMHVESVAWISERKDVLYTFFFLIALLKYHDYKTAISNRWKHYALMILFFGLSLLSKSAAVIFPVLLLAFDWYNKQKINLALILEKIPLFALSFVFGIIALKSQKEAMQNLAPMLSLTERLQIVNHSFLTYIYKFFLPVNLSAYYPYPIKDNNVLPSIYQIAQFITIGLLAVFIWIGRKNRELLFGVAFFVINLLLVLQLKPVGGAVLAERYTYMPYIGLSFPLAFWLGKKANSNKLIQAIILLVGIVFSIISFNRVQVWKNGDVLFSDVIRQFPRNPYAWDNRGGLYWDIYASKKYKSNLVKKQYYTEKAYNDYTMALQLDASFIQPWAHRGILLFNTDKFEEALNDFNVALKIDSNYVDALLGRANTLSTLKRYAEAIPDYNAYLKLRPDSAQTYVWRATAWYHIQDYNKALNDCRYAIKLNSGNAEAWYWEGICLYNLGNNEQAIKSLEKAINLNPKNQEALVWLGMAYANTKQYIKAVEIYTKAIELKPDDAVALINRSVAYYNLNSFDKALNDLDMAGKTGHPLNKDYYFAVKSGDKRFQSK